MHELELASGRRGRALEHEGPSSAAAGALRPNVDRTATFVYVLPYSRSHDESHASKCGAHWYTTASASAAKADDLRDLARSESARHRISDLAHRIGSRVCGTARGQL
jgi:hypothetical protein